MFSAQLAVHASGGGTNGEITSRRKSLDVNDYDTLEITTIDKVQAYCGLVHFFVTLKFHQLVIFAFHAGW